MLDRFPGHNVPRSEDLVRPSPLRAWVRKHRMIVILVGWFVGGYLFLSTLLRLLLAAGG